MRKALLGSLAALTIAVSAAWIVSPAAASLPNDDNTIVHVLNRIGFGPRPGDVSKVRALGLQRYLDNQLHPERIPDPAIAERLNGLTTLALGAREIAERFEVPEMQARRERRLRAGDGGATPARPPGGPERQRANQLVSELSQQKLLRAIYSERQLQEVLTDFWFNHFNVDARKGRDRFMLTEYERDVIRPHVLGKFRDLLGATAKSPAMLFYLDNWMSADPAGPHGDRFAFARPRIGNGPFVGRPRFPGPLPGNRGGENTTADPNRAPRGLNENYGRELMELHTMGVDGGYTQQDVTEVARAFTGWTIAPPRLGGGFRFEARIHDEGEKLVLGQRIKAGGGEHDGERVLDLLAKHPATARFIATKLVRRFVSDTPPAALVDRAAARFRETDGDLREVTRLIVTSPEFFSPAAHRAKVKTPFEFVVSAMRATGADVRDAIPLVRAMQQFGMPLYACQPPTGYADTADAWVNAGALVNRMNLALSLAGGQLREISVDRHIIDAEEPISDVEGTASRLIEAILSNEASDTTRATVAKAASVPQMAALILGSPEFQRR